MKKMQKKQKKQNWLDEDVGYVVFLLIGMMIEMVIENCKWYISFPTGLFLCIMAGVLWRLMFA